MDWWGKLSHVAPAVFVMHTAKIASPHFYWVESDNYHVKPQQWCLKVHKCSWKTDDNLIQINKFWIIS